MPPDDADAADPWSFELAAYGGCERMAKASRRAYGWRWALRWSPDELVAGCMIWLMAHWVQLQWTPWGYMALSLAKGLPGIAVQLVFIPLILKRLEGRVQA